MIVVESVCIQTVATCYRGGCDPLVVTMCHWLVAMCYWEWLSTTGQQLCTTMDRHDCVLLNVIVLTAMKTISSVENDYQLDGQLVCQTFSRRKMVQDIYSSRTYVFGLEEQSLQPMTWLPSFVGIVILQGHISGLEEWFLYHSME